MLLTRKRREARRQSLGEARREEEEGGDERHNGYQRGQQVGGKTLFTVNNFLSLSQHDVICLNKRDRLVIHIFLLHPLVQCPSCCPPQSYQR